MFVVLDDVDWDIHPDSPDTEHDTMRVLFLIMGGEGTLKYEYKVGSLAHFHRCSLIVEHMERFA